MKMKNENENEKYFEGIYFYLPTNSEKINTKEAELITK